MVAWLQHLLSLILHSILHENLTHQNYASMAFMQEITLIYQQEKPLKIGSYWSLQRIGA